MPENENITTYPEEPTNPSGYEGFNKSVYYILSLLRYMYYSKVESENKFYTKNGGTITGSVTIQGNLVVNGQSYSIDTENLKVGDYTITLAKDNEQTLTSMVGMVVPKYDGTNYGFFGWDADGYAYVGDLTNYDGSSAITLANNSSLQRISTIDTTNTVVASNGVIYVYDATSHCFKKPTNDNKYYVIRNGAFVETELFTEQKSKNISNSLYNLGAFDTISGNTITRQTGYVDLGSLSWTLYNNAWYTDDIKDIYIIASNTNFVITSANYPSRSYSNIESDSVVGCNCWQGRLWVNTGSTTEKPSGMAQYKLATPYTEQVIEGESILPLDSNMAQMIRQDVVDSLNTFDFDIFNKKEFTTSGNTQKEFQLEVWNDKNYTSYECVFNIFSSDESKTKTISTSKIYYCRLGYSGNVQDDKTDLIPIYLEKGTYTLSGVFTTFELNHIVYKTLMLSKGTNAYPPSDYHASKHITDEEAMLLKEEYKKSSNLYNPTTQVNGYYIDENYTEHANNLYCYNKIPVKPNTTYYMGNFQDVSLHYCHLSSNGSYLRGGYLAKNSAFTTPSDTYYLVISPRQTDNIMLNEGSHPYPYQEYNGAIVHTKDIEPVLLWENDNPESAFSNQTISISGLTNYRYLAIEYRITTSNYHAIQIEKVRYTGNTKNVFLQLVDGGNTIYHRTLQIQPTAVEFDKGKTNTTEDNSVIIPIAIYGTNVL